MVGRANAILLAAGAATLALCGSLAASAADSFTLTSTAFRDGALMPKRVGGNRTGNANCVGDNVAPPLAWSGAPEETRSFAVVMTDPEGQRGLGVTHWIAYGVPADVTSFAEGEVSKPSDKYVGGKSTQGVGVYSGPCTPPGAPHHYTFVVIATDLDPKALPPGLTAPELRAKLQGHARAATGLVGLFVNPYPR